MNDSATVTVFSLPALSDATYYVNLADRTIETAETLSYQVCTEIVITVDCQRVAELEAAEAQEIFLQAVGNQKVSRLG